MLIIDQLDVDINNIKILQNLNLIVKKGEIHILMGKNGSGKSTFANTIAGHHNNIIKHGKIWFNKKNITNLDITTRAKEGIFLAFQYAIELMGITNKLLLQTSLNAINNYKNKNTFDNFNFNKFIEKKLRLFNLKNEWLNKFVNVGLSGGQKKQTDILQMLILQPKLCILDEIDSGLDLDSIKSLIKIIKYLTKIKLVSFIIITHYHHLINNLHPNYIHIIHNGKIIKTGNKSLANYIQKYGYEKLVYSSN